MSKQTKQDWQKTWVHIQWRLGHSGDLGVPTVAPKYQVLCGLASDDSINLISES